MHNICKHIFTSFFHLSVSCCSLVKKLMVIHLILSTKFNIRVTWKIQVSYNWNLTLKGKDFFVFSLCEYYHMGLSIGFSRKSSSKYKYFFGTMHVIRVSLNLWQEIISLVTVILTFKMIQVNCIIKSMNRYKG